MKFRSSTTHLSLLPRMVVMFLVWFDRYLAVQACLQKENMNFQREAHFLEKLQIPWLNWYKIQKKSQSTFPNMLAIIYQLLFNLDYCPFWLDSMSWILGKICFFQKVPPNILPKILKNNSVIMNAVYWKMVKGAHSNSRHSHYYHNVLTDCAIQRTVLWSFLKRYFSKA